MDKDYNLGPISKSAAEKEYSGLKAWHIEEAERKGLIVSAGQCAGQYGVYSVYPRPALKALRARVLEEKEKLAKDKEIAKKNSVADAAKQKWAEQKAEKERQKVEKEKGKALEKEEKALVKSLGGKHVLDAKKVADTAELRKQHASQRVVQLTQDLDQLTRDLEVSHEEEKQATAALNAAIVTFTALQQQATVGRKRKVPPTEWKCFNLTVLVFEKYNSPITLLL